MTGRDERAELLAELSDLQHQWEATIMPSFAERVLSIPLTTQQLKVVALVVVDADGLAIADLAGTIGVSLPTMSGIIDRLAEHDMVRRASDPTDQRVRRVIPTEAGRDVLRRLVAVQPHPDQLPLEQLSLDDLRALTRGIAALLAAMQAAAPSSATSPDVEPS